LTRAFVVLCSAALFALLAADVLRLGPLARMDPEVVRLVAAQRVAWLDSVMRVIGVVHGTLPVLAATALIAWTLWRRGERSRAVLLAAVPTGMALNRLLKQLFARTRPDFDPLVQLETFSFPSGHAAAATLFYGCLCLLLLQRRPVTGARLAAVAAAVGMLVVVCFGRVYLGVHYPSDVLAGASVGCAWLAIWLAARGRWFRQPS
jgi:membrane-associated phospholipid phosphatase